MLCNLIVQRSLPSKKKKNIINIVENDPITSSSEISAQLTKTLIKMFIL